MVVGAASYWARATPCVEADRLAPVVVVGERVGVGSTEADEGGSD